MLVVRDIVRLSGVLFQECAKEGDTERPCSTRSELAGIDIPGSSLPGPSRLRVNQTCTLGRCHRSYRSDGRMLLLLLWETSMTANGIVKTQRKWACWTAEPSPGCLIGAHDVIDHQLRRTRRTPETCLHKHAPAAAIGEEHGWTNQQMWRGRQFGEPRTFYTRHPSSEHTLTRVGPVLEEQLRS